MSFEDSEVSVATNKGPEIPTDAPVVPVEQLSEKQAAREITFSVEYTVPGNQRNGLDVQLKIEEEEIISVETTHRSSDADSAGHARIFDKGIQEQAIGKNPDEIEDILISRASLTTNAFKAGLRDTI